MTPPNTPAEPRTPQDAPARLAQLFSSGADLEPDESSASPVHWPLLAGEDILSEITELYRWATQLQHRFPEMVRLPPCWHRHNGLVELLSALRDHERASYADTAAPTSAVTWIVAFRDIETRLRAWTADLRCGGDANYHDQSVHAVTVADLAIPHDVRAWAEETRATRQQAAVQAAVD